ncbi:MAG TPA: hypothetical protein VN607_09000, partial [Gemmatimonadaceae bacterium]|nr:hypothetical protein [Gemmatimonadaceae bacterium]
KAYIASMKSDLKNLATSEEAYYSDKNTYSTDTSALNFNTSTGNSLVIDAADATGWKATMTNSRVTSIASCKIGTGADTLGGGIPDGVVTCQ